MHDVVRVDPHVKVLDEETVERAAREGLDALVYAPHFTQLPDIAERARELTTDEVLVVPGREVFTGDFRNRKHVLAIGLEEPVPDFVTLEAAMAEFERQDATVLAPHPEFFTVGLEAADLREYADTIDAIEVRNPKHWPLHDRRARRLAVELDLPAFGSSYAHLPWTIGDVWTEFPRVAANGGSQAAMAPGDDASVATEDSSDDAAAPAGGSDASHDASAGIHDVESLGHALAERERTVRRKQGLGRVARGVAEFAHLFYENSKKKFDRVVLEGREATHPQHPAYEGRFDDAFVY